MEPNGVNMSPLHFIPAAGGFLNLQVEPLLTADDDDHTYIIRIIPVVIWSLNTLSYVVLDLPLPHFMSLFVEYHHDVRVYIETAAVVVISYVPLLVINGDFIALAIFPLIALAFIGALASTIRRVNGGDAGRGTCTSVTNEQGKTTTEEAEQLKAISVVPYWVLCAMGHFRAENFAVSQFLLFLSTTLGALTLMLMRLSAGVAPGATPASELLRKASLVVLLVTVHTMAAELLGENVVLFIMPELVPALLWFSLNIDSGSPIITVDRIKFSRNGLVFLGAAAAAVFSYLVAYMDESGVSRCMMISVSCAVSGLLVYYAVFMLRQWPEQGTATATSGVSYLEEAVKLLKFWAMFLLVAAAVLLLSALVAAVRLGLHEDAVPALRRVLKEYYV